MRCRDRLKKAEKEWAKKESSYLKEIIELNKKLRKAYEKSTKLLRVEAEIRERARGYGISPRWLVSDRGQLVLFNAFTGETVQRETDLGEISLGLIINYMHDHIGEAVEWSMPYFHQRVKHWANERPAWNEKKIKARARVDVADHLEKMCGKRPIQQMLNKKLK